MLTSVIRYLRLREGCDIIPSLKPPEKGFKASKKASAPISQASLRQKPADRSFFRGFEKGKTAHMSEEELLQNSGVDNMQPTGVQSDSVDMHLDNAIESLETGTAIGSERSMPFSLRSIAHSLIALTTLFDHKNTPIPDAISPQPSTPADLPVTTSPAVPENRIFGLNNNLFTNETPDELATIVATKPEIDPTTTKIITEADLQDVATLIFHTIVVHSEMDKAVARKQVADFFASLPRHICPKPAITTKPETKHYTVTVTADYNEISPNSQEDEA